MRRKGIGLDVIKMSMGILTTAFVFCVASPLTTLADTPQSGWYEENGAKYWYENGVRQGTEGRGKEIYDPASDAWYWLDAVDGGKMASGKDVYQESNGGKWVRYDANGRMVKGWDVTGGGTYYFDPTTGAMAKGSMDIDGKNCIFDENTGVGLDCQWKEIDGVKYWYEGGVRQGTEGRGKEIFDPASDAWYWLDAVDGGKMAVSKDVYQESDGGKWVRYDANGHMVKGENQQNGAWYRFDEITGAMIKGWYTTKDKNGKDLFYYYHPESGKRVGGTPVIDGKYCAFHQQTDVAYHEEWNKENNGYYWYEKGIRQGTEGRGKEIYDPATKAWYWLDAVDKGKRAVSKDVYQESNGGKWVRYDADGRMVKGWNTQDNKKYYFDPTTGAMAKGIVRINGADYYFDENTGVLQGMYEGGDVSYSWVMKKATERNSDDSLHGYTRYEYNENGLISREITYDEKKRPKTEIQYTYDSSKRIQTYSYRNYRNRNDNYTLTTEYNVSGLAVRETKKNVDGKVVEVKSFSYEGTDKNRISVYDANNVLKEYSTYTYDANGNITRENVYNSKDEMTRYTKNTYYTYGGQSYVRTSLTYDKDNRVLSGKAYQRKGHDLQKEITYTTNREISEYTVYEAASFPDASGETVFQKESNTYDKNDNLKFYTVYDYELLEFQP